jgi:hypothetical protein
VCSHCFRFVGSLEKQVGQQVSEAVDEAGRCDLDAAAPVDDSSASEAGSHQEALMALHDDALKLLHGRLTLPHTDAVPLPAAVSCWSVLRTVGLCCRPIFLRPLIGTARSAAGHHSRTLVGWHTSNRSLHLPYRVLPLPHLPCLALPSPHLNHPALPHPTPPATSLSL